MAKLKAPLLSLGASGAIGKAIVFFNWKGIDVAREYVVPANPKSDAQKTQREYVQRGVFLIHDAMAQFSKALGSLDKSAYSLWASAQGITMTWFNAALKNYLDQRVATKRADIYRGATLVEASGQVTITIYNSDIQAGGIETGNFHYGTSKTALLSTIAATPDLATHSMSKAITGLTNKQVYYFQFRPATLALWVGNDSGIYHATPRA